MTFLPIVERELRVRARRDSTYVGRVGAVILGAILMQVFLVESRAGGRIDGRSLFTGLTTLALAYCLFGGARLTSDSVSSEKRDGTLGLLFLTDLKGYDIVLGKLAANSLSSIYGLMAILPVFGVALLAGGVSGGEFGRVSLLLLCTLFFSLALGLWVSARSWDEQKITGGTNVFLAALVALPLLDLLMSGKTGYMLSFFSPGYGCYLAYDQAYRTMSAQFWICLTLLLGAGLAFLVLAGKRVIRYRLDEIESQAEQRKLAPGFDQLGGDIRSALIAARGPPKELLNANPVLWLAQREPFQQNLIWMVTGLRVVVDYLAVFSRFRSSGFAPGPSIGWSIYAGQLVDLLFWFTVASVVCRFFAQARREGTLELLMSTSLRDTDILHGLRLHVSKLLKGPLIAVAAMLLITGTIWAWTPKRSAFEESFISQLGLSIGLLYAQAWALCLVGAWFSISLKKPTHAAGLAFLMVVMAPWVVCLGFPFLLATGFARTGFFPPLHWLNPALLIVLNLLFIRWARKKLKNEFRSTALRHFTEPSVFRPKWLDAEDDLSEDFSLLR